eukprot:CAMPEP_0179182676 /NCGR_PEP_ID=MMETSP0796-20121207/90518_1 /TAXON_ID=73915 /ORGANISM="Pyrodinium bahamense, Strain pbaha01" /LENGTH=49 /DNA_ID= /DNA_START= /DNA_END= /DNA_ORIENTATION=
MAMSRKQSSVCLRSSSSSHLTEMPTGSPATLDSAVAGSSFTPRCDNGPG